MDFNQKSLDYISDAVIVIDCNFNIIFTNKTLSKWLNFKATYLINQKLEKVFPELKDRKFKKRLDRVFTLRAPVILSSLLHKKFIDIQLPSGESMIQETSIFPINEDGENFAVICIQDVTEHAKTLQMVKAASIKVKEIADAKMNFLSVISHDLRTPLNGIIGSAELLKGTITNDEQAEYVQDITTCGDYLIKLINNFLDVSKIDSNKVVLRETTVLLSGLVVNIEKLFRMQIESKGLKYIVNSNISDDLYIKIDEMRLKQILINLHSNAVKFTSNGRIEMQILYKKNKVCFIVKDTGTGISEEDQKLVFKTFEQVDIMKKESYEGFGLGLSIVKSLVDAMEGEIILQSKMNIGTQFCLTLPCVETQAEYIETKQSYDANFGHIKVLVAEDNRINQKIMCKFLLKLGIKCDMVENGELAVQKSADEKYDFIFLDHLMPILDGLQAARTIIERDGANCPILASISANALNEDRKIFKDTGFNYIIAKPYGFADIQAVFNECFSSEKSKAS